MGADVKLEGEQRKGAFSGFPDLHKAVITNSPKRLVRLLQGHHDVNEKDGNGFTPLHLAVSLQKTEIVEILLTECSADVNSQTRSGLTALHLAALETRCVAILRNLIRMGCNMNDCDNNGCTPLHLSVKNRNVPGIIVLLEKGCDHKVMDKRGRTAKDIAIELKALDLLEIINEHEERVNPNYESQPQTVFSFPRARFDYVPTLFRRSSSLVSGKLTLKPILENVNSDRDTESEEEENGYESLDEGNLSDHSSQGYTDSGSIDSVFTAMTQESCFGSTALNGKTVLEGFRKERHLSLRSFNSNDSLIRMTKTFHQNGRNNSGFSGKDVFNIPKTTVCRTRSQESSSLKSSLVRRLSLADDSLLGSGLGANGIFDVKEEDECVGNDQLSYAIDKNRNISFTPIKETIEYDFIDRRSFSSNDSNENLKIPRLRKIASSAFSVGKAFSSGENISCDEDILSILHPEERQALEKLPLHGSTNLQWWRDLQPSPINAQLNSMTKF